MLESLESNGLQEFFNKAFIDFCNQRVEGTTIVNTELQDYSDDYRSIFNQLLSTLKKVGAVEKQALFDLESLQSNILSIQVNAAYQQGLKDGLHLKSMGN